MRPETRQAAEGWRLALPGRPLGGRIGERLGRGTGTSLEFMDFRDYVPGDDLRHIDWSAYARTDQLKVRLYREEIAPALDIVVDLSPSMAVTPAKARAVEDIVEAATLWTSRAGGLARRLRADGGPFRSWDEVAFDRSDDWQMMRLRVERSLSEIGHDILAEAEESTDKFDSFFNAFARTGLRGVAL